jgi:DNA-directed RNA polymerase specialized sigma24 family protein
MDSEPTDKDLLSQLRTDPAAFETFYWRHLDRVIGFTARRVREPADVADVVAATFLTVLTAARSYDPGRGEPTAWLLGITARLIARENRRRYRENAATARIIGHRLIDASDIERLEERIDAARSGAAGHRGPQPAQAEGQGSAPARLRRWAQPHRGGPRPGHQRRGLPDAAEQRPPGAQQGHRRGEPQARGGTPHTRPELQHEGNSQ